MPNSGREVKASLAADTFFNSPELSLRQSLGDRNN